MDQLHEPINIRYTSLDQIEQHSEELELDVKKNKHKEMAQWQFFRIMRLAASCNFANFSIKVFFVPFLLAGPNVPCAVIVTAVPFALIVVVVNVTFCSYFLYENQAQINCILTDHFLYQQLPTT